MTQTLNDTRASDDIGATTAAPVDLSVIRRDGSTAPFDAGRIIVAITKAFLAVEGEKAQTSSRLRSLVSELTGDVAPHCTAGTHRAVRSTWRTSRTRSNWC